LVDEVLGLAGERLEVLGLALIDEVLGLACERLLDVRHQSNHHLGQTLGAVYANVEARLLPVRRHVVRQQQVSTSATQDLVEYRGDVRPRQHWCKLSG